MTSTEKRVLDALRAGPKYPHEIYSAVSPNGRFIAEVDRGSAKGGPSRREYAANNYLGKLDKKGLVTRRSYHYKGLHAGKWLITGNGLLALEAEGGL